MEIQNTLKLIFEFVYVITAIGIVFVVISENRNPLKTISWALLLLLFPIGGIIIYYFFGQNTRRLRIISKRTYKLLKKRTFDHLIIDDVQNMPSKHLSLVKLLNNSGAVLLRGSDTHIFTDGQKKFNALIQDLENATHHIHLQYYIFEDDELGTAIKNILMRRASEGIEVRVLYDDVANWKIKNEFYDEMEKTGVEVTSYLKVRFPLFTSKVNYRNHRKIVVIDGKIGYIGGMNIADRYLTPAWRDTHLRVEGKAVLGMQSAFLIDWCSSGKSLTSDKVYFPNLPIMNENLMQIVTGGPISPWRTLLQATIHIISNAKEYVFIQTPYFLPTEGLLQVMQMAALGGIDVRLMIPARSDVRFVNTAAQSYFDDIMKAGVKIYAMEPAFLHAKVMVSDDFVSVVGSANMDFRSFEHNFEVNAYVYDASFALKIKDTFINDQEKCTLISLKEWRKRPIIRKFKESVTRMFSPLL